MSTRRYWRVSSLSTLTDGEPLALSELQLVDSAQSVLTAGVALAANFPPALGALADLADASVSGTVTWDAHVLSKLTLTWDFGASPVQAAAVRFAAPVQGSSLLSLRLESSADGSVWTEEAIYFPLVWQGTGLTVLAPPNKYWHNANVTGVELSSDLKVANSVSLQANLRGGTLLGTGIRQFEVTINCPDASSSNGIDYYGVGVGVESPAAGSLGTVPGTFALISNAEAMMAGTPKSGYGNFVKGDVIGVVVDFSVGSLTFYKNGVSMGIASATGLLGLTVAPRINDRSGWTARQTFARLEPEAFVYPVAGASAWVGAVALATHPLKLGRVTPIRRAAVRGWNAAVSAPASRTPLIPRRSFQLGWLDPGNGKVTGTVKKTGEPSNMPVKRKVRLIREQDGMVIRETWSHPLTGAYSFTGLRMDYVYTVLAYDYERSFRAVVADGVIPESMT